jgi:hypothetical protein
MSDQPQPPPGASAQPPGASSPPPGASSPPPGASSPPLAEILSSTVYVDGANRPFGELTVAQVRARADELRAATGWGPTARVAPVARAWRELTLALERSGAETVAGLDAGVLSELAPRLWVVPPGGGLLA